MIESLGFIILVCDNIVVDNILLKIDINLYVDFYRTQVYLGSDLWVRVSETHKHTLLKHIQVILVMMVTKKLDDVHKKLISSTFGPKKGHFGQSGP